MYSRAGWKRHWVAAASLAAALIACAPGTALDRAGGAPSARIGFADAALTALWSQPSRHRTAAASGPRLILMLGGAAPSATRAPAKAVAARPPAAPVRADPRAVSSFVETTASSAPAGFGCEAALAWLWDHAAPDFRLVCPGYALGRQAMTCVNEPGVCPGQREIVIADPCPAAYMNEASNSWVLEGVSRAAIDPYGSCP